MSVRKIVYCINMFFIKLINMDSQYLCYSHSIRTPNVFVTLSIGYSDAINLQHKTSGISFRVESGQPGFYTPVARLEGRTALLRAYYSKKRRLYLSMNKTGEFKCTFGNDVASNTASSSDYIYTYERITDVLLIFRNISATNESVSFLVPPHPGGDVSYTFQFGQNESVVVENQTSTDNLTLNYTFTKSGFYQVNLTVRNVKLSFDLLSGMRCFRSHKGVDVALSILCAN